MILGLSTYAYGWAVGKPDNAWHETDLIQTALDLGLRCIQIGDNLPLHTFSAERISDLKNTLEENLIRIEVGSRKLTEESLEQYIDICRNLDSPLLRFVFDADGYEPDLITVERIIRNALPELTNNKIVLAIENHDRFKAKDLADLMERIDNSFAGICLDCANSIGAGEGLEHVAGLLAPHTVNFHIKEFNIERLPHKMGFTVRGERLGKGMIDLEYVMGLLQKYGRCQSAILEQWVPPEQDMQATIEKEKRWAREGIEYLRMSPWFK